MADEVISSPQIEAAPAAAPIEAAPAAPVDSAPAAPVAPSQDSNVASAVEPTLSQADAPAEATTILGSDPEAKTPEAPTDTKPDSTADQSADAPQDEGSQTDEPAPLPTYEPFTLPEGITADEEQLGRFTEILAKNAAKQEFGQELIDLHVAEVQNTVERLNKFYTDHFEKTKNDWKDQFIKDPEIGGNRQETTVNSALEFIRTHGGSSEQQAEFRNLMESTGVGNHPAMIRLLAKANMAMSEGRPLPAQTPAPAPKSRVKTMYGG